MSKRGVQLGVAAVAVLFLGAFAAWWRLPHAPETPLDEFARCLTAKGAVMYGAYWCPHCQKQKAMFGDAVKFLNYVECTEEPEKCTNAGIQAFPTWLFAGGIRLVGTQSFEALAGASGCALPSNR